MGRRKHTAEEKAEKKRQVKERKMEEMQRRQDEKAGRKQLLSDTEAQLRRLVATYGGSYRGTIYAEGNHAWKEGLCLGQGADFNNIGRSYKRVSSESQSSR
jgi:hypothetical protein